MPDALALSRYAECRMNRAVRLGDSAAEIPHDVHQQIVDDGIIQRFAARRVGAELQAVG